MPSAKNTPALSDAEEAAIQAGIAQDPDNPEFSDGELAGLRPASEMLPADLLAPLPKRRPGREVRKGASKTRARSS